jgi:hypothetical protein
MRKTTAALMALVLGCGAVGSLPAAVLASNGAATPFASSYDNGGSHWDCHGARIDNRVSVKDSETCLVTGDLSDVTPGVYQGDPYGDLPWFANARWQSDFDPSVALDWTVRVVDNGDGSATVLAVAYYEYR